MSTAPHEVGCGDPWRRCRQGQASVAEGMEAQVTPGDDRACLGPHPVKGAWRRRLSSFAGKEPRCRLLADGGHVCPQCRKDVGRNLERPNAGVRLGRTKHVDTVVLEIPGAVDGQRPSFLVDVLTLKTKYFTPTEVAPRGQERCQLPLYRLPRPALDVEPGAAFTVMVPPWYWGRPTDLTISRPDVLRELCSVLVAGGGRRVVVLAQARGQSLIEATVTPGKGDAAMPAWVGEVTVVAPAPAPVETTTTEASVPPPPTSRITTTVITAPPGDSVLTQSSAGQSYSITPGQLVQVVLPGTGQQFHGYTTPQSDSAAVQLDGRACGAPSRDFCTEFVGKGGGSARLTSTLEPACRQATPPCEVASMVWWVDLTVR